MFLTNTHENHGKPLVLIDAETLGPDATTKVERHLSYRQTHKITPLHSLPALAAENGVSAIHVKDEGYRLGLRSFKALGGAYAVSCLVLEEASRQLGRQVDISELHEPDVCAIASKMTFACATDGNHGRSVAQGAQMVGAKSAIFVHGGVSEQRIEAIAAFGANMIRVEGTYDDSVTESARVAEKNGWTIVSDTSWPGYERIPGLVMQGYTAMIREALSQMAEPPTHVFVQAGVGGVAASVSGYLALQFGDKRPVFVVVEPARSACLYASAEAGKPVKIAHGEPTVMAMLECYDPSPVAFRILSRTADAFMTVDEDDAVNVMNRLARPKAQDPAIVAGESGGAGLAGLLVVAKDSLLRTSLKLDEKSRILVFNTEGATDPDRYRELTGLEAAEVAGDLP